MRYILFIIYILSSISIYGQKGNDEFWVDTVIIDGVILKAIISEDDTILIADLDEISVTARNFDNRAEERQYSKMRRHASKVYPYAIRAIKVFREIEVVTNNMKKRKRKRYLKKLQRQLDKEFKRPLSKLTVSQGKILMKMIERELDQPIYQIVKELRGGFKAFYWNRFGRIYGFDIKEGYNPKEDSILEYVLSDYDVSYQVPADSDFRK